MPATAACADTEYGSELKSVRISGTASSGTGGTGSAQATGAGNTHGNGPTSQPPSGPHSAARAHDHVLGAALVRERARRTRISGHASARCPGDQPRP